MCTMIVQKAKVDGSGKGQDGWFTLDQANVSFDHPFDAPFEHALNIDFVNASLGPSARIVRTNSRAADSLNSTATRAEGPSEVFTKSIFKACSNGASKGWSKETLA